MAIAFPSHHAVAYLPGSLPMGGVVPMTPVHAFDASPDALQLPASSALQPERRDIDLEGQLAFSIEPVITAEEARAIIAATEQLGYRDEAPGIVTPPGMRMNKSVHWVADAGLMEPLFQRIAHLLPATLDGHRLFPGFSHRINMYRYDANDVFNRHTDGDWPGYSLSPQRDAMLQWPDTVRSGLTMLLYLNDAADGVQGGNTRLLKRSGQWVDIVPVTGAALFFRHGFGPNSVVHEGSRVTSATPKYVARINVMYGEAFGQ